MDYCNGILAGLPQSTLAALQRVQNAAARLVLGLRPYDHTQCGALRQLHWLPVYYRVQYKLSILMYSIAKREALVYLGELVRQTCEMTSRSNLHSSVNNTYVKYCTKTKFGQRAFSIAGPLAWNALPTALRTISCKDTFKRHLKTHYFNLAFFRLVCFNHFRCFIAALYFIVCMLACLRYWTFCNWRATSVLLLSLELSRR